MKRFFPIVAVLAAGISLTDGLNGQGKKEDKQKPIELADEATAIRVCQVTLPFLEGPDVRLKKLEFVNVGKVKSVTRNGKPAEAVYVQFRAVNKSGDEELHQADLLVIQEGKVVEYLRTEDAIKKAMTAEWYEKNPPPSWPEIKPNQASANR